MSVTEDTGPTPAVDTHIAEDLRGLAVPTDSLGLMPGNPRIGNVEAVAASLKRFGQRKPVVVRRSDSAVIAGNHTLIGARRLGWPTIAAVFVDDDDATGRAYSLADNRTGDLGVYDDELLLGMIRDVEEFDEALLSDTGWGAEAVDALQRHLESLSGEPAQWTNMPEFSVSDLQGITVTVHFQTEEYAEEFFKLIDRPRSRTFWWPTGDGHVGETNTQQIVTDE